MNPCKALFLIGVLFASAASAYARHELVADSTIASVIVYPDSARVTRTVEIAVQPGETECYFDFLPSGIDTSSIKALIEGSSGQVVVRDVTVKNNDMDIEEHPELKQLRSEEESLKEDIAKLEQNTFLVHQRKTYAANLMKSFTDGYGEREGDLPPTEQVEAVWSFYEKTVDDTQSQLDELEAQMKPLREQLKTNQKSIEELRQRLGRCRTTVVVFVDSVISGDLVLKLDYQVYGCSWQPVYELRADPLKKTVDVRYQASIRQDSGEDWNQVALKLSTSRATSWGNAPELSPIRLNKVEPIPTRKRMAVGSEENIYELSPFSVEAESNAGYMASQTLAGTRLNTSLEDVGSAIRVATNALASTFSSFEVTLPQRFSIESGEGNRKALLAEAVLDAEFWTEVVPRYNEKGYLKAEVTNTFELPILSGESMLFVDNQMVGKGSLFPTPIGEKIELSLGMNENIAVEREIGKQNEVKRGLFGNRTQLTRQYFTVIKNHSATEQQLKLVDQFPISENEKIEVKRLVPREDEAEFEEDTGIYSISFILKSGEERKVENRFEVVYPEDWIIPTNF